MLKNRAGWLALAVLAIATVLMVFFVMPRISGSDKPVGDAVNSAGREVKEAIEKGGSAARELVTPDNQQQDSKTPAATAKNELLPAPEKAAPAGTPTVAPAEKAEAPVIIPTFDVLRVEPDGSTVIAGRAAPNAKLDVTDQTKTVASTKVDKAGEFVAILDAPLAPGDHQLVLKATTEDGKTVISAEIATVSVPQGKESELLAMVTKPGEASRIIAKPSAQAKTERVAMTQPAAAVPQTETQKPATATAEQPASTATANAPEAPKVETESASTPAASTEKPDLQVSAVEVEGNKLFVAGVAKPGARVKAYADGEALGQTTANKDGSFVIDGIRELSVGQHQIAVDHLGPGDKPLVRVEVPFNRPAGDQVAAVASAQGTDETLTPIDAGAFDKLRNEVGKAFSLLQNLYADGATPDMERVAAARSAVTFALRSLTEYRLPAGTDANAAAIAASAAKAASDALTTLEALPKDVEAVRKNLDTLATMIARVTSSSLPSTRITAPPAPAAVADAGNTASPRTIEQAPLEKSEASSVIIRRGDTLWQIARRVYGQGVRYTTIYLANQDQIANPDIIQPGQIFGVPKDALPEPEAEKLHRERLNKS